MAKYIKGKDGKFAGSIGEGKQSLPLVRPPRGVSLFPAAKPVGRPDLVDMYARFQDLRRERQSLAQQGLAATVTAQYPQAATVVVEEEDSHDALNGYPTALIPVKILTSTGQPLWQQTPHNRDNTDFSTTIEAYIQDLPEGVVEASSDDTGLHRRFEIPLPRN